ncbi:BZ3500_MvSof-1268-A1-R1_Chr1-1g00860 [Microbotryum saponariae]|uniref:BZ3500_MvSof-1268-A1-R1_Chr1-1g00860 protein n=1 Tax=Microbotryum saponariae TaxID=289078 RepID=A0A2X0KE04_9BASI|nr:BZ3500_MvSof-1268-A1-R1_Chr1-1g00860 [Microbotryum saponariae]SCZ92798.1 BZ3501_MvSof-1269-A2-R1_Chr1-1g00457 [Microbotryum saponariae]
MLGFLTLAAAALGASTVVAQTSTSNSTGGVDASSLPACALICALSSLSGSGCATANVTCVCTDSTYQLQFYNCQTKTCNATDLQAAFAFGAKTCAANGTPINTGVVPSGASTTAAGPSQTGTATSARTATAVATSAAAAAATTTKASGAGSLVAQTLGGLLAFAAGVTMLL